MPKVSVCIPAYRATYLRRTIDSVLAQTYQDFELVVADDCPTNDVAETVATYNDLRLSYHRNDHNLGMMANWNHCLELAQGEYIAILHDDDAWLPRFLERQVAMLDTHPRVGLAYTATYIIDGDDRRIGLYQPYPDDRILNGRELARRLILGERIYCPAAIITRRCYEAVGRYDEAMRIAADVDMYTRIGLAFDVAYIAEPLSCYRHHSDNSSDIAPFLKLAPCTLPREFRTVLSRVCAQLKAQGEDTRQFERAARQFAAESEYLGALRFLFAGHTQRFRQEAWDAFTVDPPLPIRKPLWLPYLLLSFAGRDTVLGLVSAKRRLERVVGRRLFEFAGR